MNDFKGYPPSVAMKRASTRQWVLKPQDLAVALKIAVTKGSWTSYAQLGSDMALSQYEAHAAVQRLIAARLVVVLEGLPQAVVSALRQFVIYGAPYVYPPVRGEMTIGLATAHGALPLKDMVTPSNEPVPVWPYPKGKVRGMSLLPLYEKLPIAAMEDKNLYELLALFDALRAGQAREKEMAKKLLEERLQ